MEARTSFHPIASYPPKALLCFADTHTDAHMCVSLCVMQVLLDRQIAVARWFLMGSSLTPAKPEKSEGGEPETERKFVGRAGEVVGLFLRAIRTHIRIHALVWRHLGECPVSTIHACGKENACACL